MLNLHICKRTFKLPKMKCSILGCPSVYERKGQHVSFHGFPNNPKILTAWVAATGIPDFIPTHTSKICSAHFDDGAYIGPYRKLKPDAVPIKLLPKDATRRVSEYLRKQRESNPMACILGTDTSMQQVALVRDNVLPRPKSIIVSTPKQPPPLTPAPSSTIKVVDMKKLLQPQPPSVTVAGPKSAFKPITSDSSTVKSFLSQYTKTKEHNKYSPELFVNRTGIKASQVLTCLKVILPGTFDLSRLVPNEKVASLVIRYLKRDEKNEDLQKVVKDHLKIIIEAVKAKDNKSVDYIKHPYTKINDKDLKRALTVVLPENFSMIDITDELLGLICITLKLDIYTDAYYILIRKIRKFTSEGQKFSEILNRGNKVYDATLEMENKPETNENTTASQGGHTRHEQTVIDNENSADSDVVCIGEQRRELVFVDVNNPAENIQESVGAKPTNNEVVTQPTGRGKTIELDSDSDSSSDSEEVVSKGCKRKKSNSDVDLDWEPETKLESNKITEAQPQPNVEKLLAIVTYLDKNKCSADDALSDFQLMFNLCRFIQIRPRRGNLKKLESKLNYIIDNKISMINVEDHLQQVYAKRFLLRSKQSTGKQRTNTIKKIFDDKLKMKPVVVLPDLLNYTSDQLLFMRKKKVKSNGFYNQIPFSLKQNQANKKYSTEQVRKLTDDSYKQFRRIIMKKDGTKAVFRVKYVKLVPGTVVYAKNFRHPGVGWVKGVVGKSEGPFKYQVKLDNNSLWCCTVDQLRPLLNKVVDSVESQALQRSHRPIKPKQLFDL